MLKCELNGEKHEVNVEFEGNIVTILSDVTMFIHTVHDMLNEDSPKVAEMFKEMMPKAVELALIPDDELEERASKATEGLIDDTIESLKKMKERLK